MFRRHLIIKHIGLLDCGMVENIRWMRFAQELLIWLLISECYYERCVRIGIWAGEK